MNQADQKKWDQGLEVQRLRAQGLSWDACGHAVGIARNTAKARLALVAPPVTTPPPTSKKRKRAVRLTQEKALDLTLRAAGLGLRISMDSLLDAEACGDARKVKDSTATMHKSIEVLAKLYHLYDDTGDDNAAELTKYVLEVPDNGRDT